MAAMSATLIMYCGYNIVGAVLSIFFVLTVSYLFVLFLKHKHRTESFSRYRRDMVFVGFLWLAMSVVVDVIWQYTANEPMADLLSTLVGSPILFVRLSELLAPYVFGVIFLRHRPRFINRYRSRRRV